MSDQKANLRPVTCPACGSKNTRYEGVSDWGHTWSCVCADGLRRIWRGPNPAELIGEKPESGEAPRIKTTIEQVEEFHKAFGVIVGESPWVFDEGINRLRITLLTEELEELDNALDMRDPVAVLDALTDLQYILDGAYLSLGFHRVKDIAFAEVHQSNMSKLGSDGNPVYRKSDGKVLKGPRFKTPDLRKILKEHFPLTKIAP